MAKIKQSIKKIVLSNRRTANIYFNKLYGKTINDDLILSRIQQIAHRFDHRFMNAMSAHKKDIHEMEFLLDIATTRRLKFEDSLMWALSLYAMAKLNATHSYKVKTKESKTENYNSILSDIMKERRSVRKWKTNNVDLGLVMELIQTSLWSPSSCNRQPIRIIVLDNKQKEFIKNYFHGSFWHKAPVQLLILCNTSTYGKMDVFFPYLDGGAFIQNMLLLLHEAELGACWLGFKQWNTKQEIFCDSEAYNAFYDYFKIEKAIIPISMIVAGEHEIIPKAPARQSLDTVMIKPGG